MKSEPTIKESFRATKLAIKAGLPPGTRFKLVNGKLVVVEKTDPDYDEAWYEIIEVGSKTL